jgi:nucleotide-binding universal stress UspA family protein
MMPNTPAAPEFVPMPPTYYDAMRVASEQRLDRDAAELRQSGLTVESELVVGRAVTGVLEAAERHRADLLVAGTRGRTGWKRFLLGSTAKRLVRDAPCPVLTVHEKDAGPPRPLHTVLVPTDFSEDATLAVEAAASALAPEGERRLVLVHAFGIPIETEHHPARLLIEALRAAEGTAQARIEALRTKLERPGLTIETLVREGHPADVILAHAEAVRADLIAMGTHGRSGIDRLLLGSTTERVLPLAPCPVLTVHQSEENGAP